MNRLPPPPFSYRNLLWEILTYTLVGSLRTNLDTLGKRAYAGRVRGSRSPVSPTLQCLGVPSPSLFREGPDMSVDRRKDSLEPTDRARLL